MQRHVYIAKKRLLLALALVTGAVSVAVFSAEPEQLAFLVTVRSEKPEQPVVKESLLKGFSGDCAPVMDLDNDLACYFHTRDLLRRKMDLLANCGFDRVYIVAPPPGEPDYSTRILPADGPPNFLRQSREALGDDALKLSIAYAKAAGLKAFVVMKPYEGGGSFSVPHNFVPPCGRNWIETLGGRAVGLDPFILEHPEMRVKRRPTDEKLSQSVDRIELTFAVGDVKEPPYYPAITNVITKFPATNFHIYTSSNNGSYADVSTNISVTDILDNRSIYGANGELVYTGSCRVITLTGFSLDSNDTYFAVSFSGSNSAFRTIPYSETGCTAYSGTNELPVTVSPKVRDGLLTGRYGFQNNGFEFNEIGPYYWNHGWKQTTLFGFARGKTGYQRGALCEAYPEVRAHWLGEIQHYIDLGCDGVDIRLQCHSAGITDFINYGFNSPLVSAYQAQYGTNSPIDPIQMMKVRGGFFMDFVKNAADLLHTNGLILQMHMNSCLENPTLDPTFPGAGFWAAPKVVPDWREMVAVADEITIKDYNWGVYSSEKADAIKDLVSAAGKPLWIDCYMQQGHDLNDVFLDQAENDPRVTGILLYEVKYSAGTVNDGMVEFTGNNVVQLVPGSPFYEMLVNPPEPLLPGAMNHAVADTYIEPGDSTPNGSMTSMPIGDDGAGDEKWGFVKWDLSYVPSDQPVVAASFEILQTDYTVGDGVDVYAIDSGDWDESTLTWDVWTNMSTSISWLGTMTPIVRFSDGVCSFSNSNLTERVQQWHTGEKPNYGLLLKWHHDTQWGSDTFVPREHPGRDPMLMISYSTVPEFGTKLKVEDVCDVEIDQHVNYNSSNLEGATSMRVETRSTAYTNPVESPQSWALIKWDLSRLPPETLLDRVTLRLIQTDSAVGTVDVYGVNAGAWTADTVTWNNWVGTESLSFLGTVTNTAYYRVSTLTSTNLTDLVQGWVDGGHTNLGVLLKWSGGVGEGVSYITIEDPDQDPPSLIITTNSSPESSVMSFN